MKTIAKFVAVLSAIICVASFLGASWSDAIGWHNDVEDAFLGTGIVFGLLTFIGASVADYS